MSREDFASILGRKVQVFIAGDDETAKAKVSDLVKAAEFEPRSITSAFSSPWAR
jgi:predicted dinucleotide-binding enzyme